MHPDVLASSPLACRGAGGVLGKVFPPVILDRDIDQPPRRLRAASEPIPASIPESLEGLTLRKRGYGIRIGNESAARLRRFALKNDTHEEPPNRSNT